jgi:hypothetical protein
MAYLPCLAIRARVEEILDAHPLAEVPQSGVDKTKA